MAEDRKKRVNPAVWVGLLLATVLFILSSADLLKPFSINTDEPTRGCDYFALPRCGLAVRQGTDPFESAWTYGNYGPYGPDSTVWTSHPALCWYIGVPLSFLPPWVGYWILNGFYFLLHLGLIWFFGRRLDPLQVRKSDYVFFAAVGFFIPWHTMYYYGHFHAFVVLALGLVLFSPRLQIAGFMISGLGKPLLIPTLPVLLVRRRWKVVSVSLLGIGVASLPWIWTSSIHSVNFFIWNAWRQTTHIKTIWSQMMGLAVALKVFLPLQAQFYLRLFLALLVLYTGAVLLRRKNVELGIAVATLWFFFLYAFGFEYQLTVYIPILLYLYTTESERYRGWPLAVIALLLAVPTTYPVFKLLYGPGDSSTFSSRHMLELNPILYLLFLWQKPICIFLLSGLIFRKEQLLEPLLARFRR